MKHSACVIRLALPFVNLCIKRNVLSGAVTSPGSVELARLARATNTSDQANLWNHGLIIQHSAFASIRTLL